MFKNIHSPEIKDDIVKRLEELNKWQEEQKKLLIDRQNMQRQMLGIEQRRTYEMLGILPDGVGDKNDSTLPLVRLAGLEQNHFEKSEDVALKLSDVDDLTSAKEVICTEDQEVLQRNPCQNSKKPFLRRGEGLKQRFKIDPEVLRLNNLPRYKYANAHPRIRNLSQTNRRKSIQATKPAELPKSESKESLDVQEKHFRQLFSSKNLSNSTPDVKMTKSQNRSEAGKQQKVRFLDTKNALESRQDVQEEKSTNSEKSVELPISWAKVLDARQIKAIPVKQLRSAKNSCLQEDTDDNLSIFELLEEKANEGSIDMNSSCIKNFLSKKLSSNDNDEDDIPVEKSLHTAGLKPSIVNHSLIQSETEEEEETTGTTQTRHESDYDTTLTPDKTQYSRQTAVVVRFSDSNDTHEYQEESETSSSGANESSSLDILQQFKQALLTLLHSKESDKNITDSTISNTSSLLQSSINNSKPPILSEDLQAIMNRIKSRLVELEKEIATFKENNIQLIRAKQQHELEKAQLHQERLEALDKLNDEKIQMEIYLHDERMKIEEERRKFERQMQMQKTSINSKSRKELNQLKAEIEDLQAQLKQKEQMHVAAQARLRVQIRNFEKDQKQLYDDIERLTKENKRLQNENLKISRENNNKMLQEINRNIAKLAPKLTQVNFKDTEAVRCSREESNVSTANGKPSKKHPLRSSHSACLKNFKPATDTVDYSSSDYDEYENNSISRNKKKVEKNAVSADDAKGENRVKPQKGESQASVNCTEKGDSTNEFKREIINSDGSKDILYSNGNLKKISPDGMSIRMLYFNKDIKETNINEGTVKYYYAETNTWHTTYLDGLEILEFPNGQTEHRYKNGIVEVHFPNNSIKVSNPADEHKMEEWRFADGTNLVEMRNGDKILMLPNGQKEIHTKQNKRREYPDGTVKIVYPDGSQETRYSNGRVRLKDKNGQLVMDTENVT